MVPILRVARPSDEPEALLPFYVAGLGFEVLYRFAGHGAFSGVMIGHPGSPYHLEFTRAEGHIAGRAPTQDNLLIFYLPDRDMWEDAVAAMRHAGFPPVAAFNAYWDQSGATFEDPDGYRVVLQNTAWSR
jgi:catechol 2,3-dioxygenase-like lactoylglutathione lyase family enzyme